MHIKNIVTTLFLNLSMKNKYSCFSLYVWIPKSIGILNSFKFLQAICKCICNFSGGHILIKKMKVNSFTAKYTCLHFQTEYTLIRQLH